MSKMDSAIEPALRARKKLYTGLKKLGVALDRPEEQYTLDELIDITFIEWAKALQVIQEWSHDHELAEAYRDTQRHINSGAEVFGGEFTGGRLSSEKR